MNKTQKVLTKEEIEKLSYHRLKAYRLKMKNLYYALKADFQEHQDNGDCFRILSAIDAYKSRAWDAFQFCDVLLEYHGEVQTRTRRGKEVLIPVEWRGQTVSKQTIRKRASKRGQGKGFKRKAMR